MLSVQITNYLYIIDTLQQLITPTVQITASLYGYMYVSPYRLAHLDRKVSERVHAFARAQRASAREARRTFRMARRRRSRGCCVANSGA